MAISTLDQASAGSRPPVALAKAATGVVVAGRPWSSWATAGTPGAGGYDTTAAGATRTSATAGAILKSDPTGGQFSYLYKFLGVSSAQGGVLYLVDRLWQGGGLNPTLTTAQTVNSVAWPSRCPTSATDDTPSINGHGVLVGLEVSASTGAGTPTLTLTYTNSAGTGSRTSTNIDPTVASSAAGTFYRFGWQAGDAGIRSIQSYQQSATWTSGTINLVAYRIVGSIPLIGAGIPAQIDWVSGGADRIYDSACLQMLYVPQTTTTTLITGEFIETHG